MVTSITALPTPPSRDDAANFSDRADAFLAAFPTLRTQINALATELVAIGAQATADALTAVNAPGTNGTSSSSVAIGTGAKALTTQTGKAWVVGMFVTVASTASPTNWMHGQISAYNSGTGALTVDVINTNGAGTLAAWTISLAPPSYLSPASASDIRAGTSNAVAVTPAGIAAALAEVVIADGATITMTMANLINGVLTLGGSRILANPVIAASDVGKTGRIRIVQDATGNRTLSYGSYFKWEAGVVFVLSTAAAAEDYIYYEIVSTTKIVLSTKKAVS